MQTCCAAMFDRLPQAKATKRLVRGLLEFRSALVSPRQQTGKPDGLSKGLNAHTSSVLNEWCASGPLRTHFPARGAASCLTQYSSGASTRIPAMAARWACRAGHGRIVAGSFEGRAPASAPDVSSFKATIRTDAKCWKRTIGSPHARPFVLAAVLEFSLRPSFRSSDAVLIRRRRGDNKVLNPARPRSTLSLGDTLPYLLLSARPVAVPIRLVPDVPQSSANDTRSGSSVSSCEKPESKPLVVIFETAWTTSDQALLDLLADGYRPRM